MVMEAFIVRFQLKELKRSDHGEDPPAIDGWDGVGAFSLLVSLSRSLE